MVSVEQYLQWAEICSEHRWREKRTDTRAPAQPGTLSSTLMKETPINTILDQHKYGIRQDKAKQDTDEQFSDKLLINLLTVISLLSIDLNLNGCNL